MSEPSLAAVVHEAIERTIADLKARQPVTLTEFLLARIDEQREVAESVQAESIGWTVVGDVPLGWQRPVSGTRRGSPMMMSDCLYVLAECEAKRRIVAELGDYDDGYVWASGEGHRARSALEALAQPYADHPDFDPAWQLSPLNRRRAGQHA